MHIRPIDLDNAAEFQQFYTCFRAAQEAEGVDRPLWAKESMAVHLREPVSEEAYALGAFEGGEVETVVGAALLFYPVLDNVTMAFIEVLVAPANRRRGIGSALVLHLLERIASDGRSVVLAEATYGLDRRDDHPYRRFAEKHGFAVASTDIWRRLDLPVPDEQIQAWIDEAKPHHADYRISTYSGDLPDDLLPSLCRVLNQLIVDAPTGDIDFEAEQMTPEIWRQMESVAAKEGLRRYDTVAVDARGEVVAVTTLAIPAGDSGKILQWATLVLTPHRGHRLGLALKAHNLRAVQRDHPDRVSVHAGNEETNGPMVDINDRIGFTPIELSVGFQRKLDA